VLKNSAYFGTSVVKLLSICLILTTIAPFVTLKNPYKIRRKSTLSSIPKMQNSNLGKQEVRRFEPAC